jgi:hypothetical protein
LYDGLVGLTPKSIGTPSRIPSWLSEPGSRRGKGRFESGPARLWRMSKLERRLTLPFGVVAKWSEGSGRGEGGGELEVLRDMGIRGAS